MVDRFLVSPYFIDKTLPELEQVAGPGWTANRVEIAGPTASERVGVWLHPLASWIAEVAAAGDRPVSVAGDCVSSLAVLAGLQRAGIPPTLLWLDAHGDFNTWETTPSGFLGGMPLAMLTGRGDRSLVSALSLEPIDDKRVILCDGRDLDPLDSQAVAGSGIAHMRHADALLDLAVDGPLYVHLDTDWISPVDAPAMRYPADGGPTATEAARLLAQVARRNNVVAASLSAWAPELDGDGATRRSCMNVFVSLLQGRPTAQA